MDDTEVEFMRSEGADGGDGVERDDSAFSTLDDQMANGAINMKNTSSPTLLNDQVRGHSNTVQWDVAELRVWGTVGIVEGGTGQGPPHLQPSCAGLGRSGCGGTGGMGVLSPGDVVLSLMCGPAWPTAEHLSLAAVRRQACLQQLCPTFWLPWAT